MRPPLPGQVLEAMRRLASMGEEAVTPSRIADLISPRPSAGAMSHAVQWLWESGQINEARVGVGRYCLPPAVWSE